MPSAAPYVVVLDPSAWAYNLGDRIISKSSLPEVESVAVAAGLPAMIGAWHDSFGVRAKRAVLFSSSVVLMGANSLAPLSGRRRKVQIGPLDLPAIGHKAVLVGVGASSEELGPYSTRLWRGLLDPDAPHAVRDNLAADHLRAFGIPEENIFVTGCPTTWRLPTIGTELAPARHLVYLDTPSDTDDFTSANLTLLSRHYDSISVFRQGVKTRFRRTLPHSVRLLRGGLLEYETLLAAEGDERVDVVGTRLHGGIRALQMGRRALILAIDHRAREQSLISGVPVTESADAVAAITRFVAGDWQSLPTPPLDRVDSWRVALTTYWSGKSAI